MPPPHWADPLPVLPVNNGVPARTAEPVVTKHGKRRLVENCPPRITVYGRQESPVKTSAPISPSRRGGFARLGRKIIK